MITIIYGPPGVGKTAFMTYLAQLNMIGRNARLNIKESEKKVNQLVAGGYTELAVPDNHLVFSDYLITKGSQTSYSINGYYLALENDNFKSIFLPPNANLYLDEAQKYYNSRKSKFFNQAVSRFYELHRHYGLNIVMTCQRPGLIDLNVRELARFIKIVKMQVVEEYGKIVKVVWHCLEFENVFEMESFLASGEKIKLKDLKTYVYNKNIFKNYDSCNFFATFLKNKRDREFNVFPGYKPTMTVDEIDLYNKLFDYTVPKGYYDKGDYKK